MLHVSMVSPLRSKRLSTRQWVGCRWVRHYDLVEKALMRRLLPYLSGLWENNLMGETLGRRMPSRLTGPRMQELQAGD